MHTVPSYGGKILSRCSQEEMDSQRLAKLISRSGSQIPLKEDMLHGVSGFCVPSLHITPIEIIGLVCKASRYQVFVDALHGDRPEGDGPDFYTVLQRRACERALCGEPAREDYTLEES